MRCARGLVALLALLGAASEAAAQVVLAAPPQAAGGVTIGGGLGLGRHHGSKRFSLYVSGGFNRSYLTPLPAYPAGASITVVSVYAPPPVVVLPAAEPDDPLFDLLMQGRLPPGLPPLMERPVEPDNRGRQPPPEQPKPRAPDRPRAPAPPPPAPPKPKPDEPKAKPPEPRPAPELPAPPAPEPNPRGEHNRQAGLGRQAFAAGEYGRAAHRFRLAVAALPEEAMGHFLLAQALYALGKYDESVAEVLAGLRLRPDWPLTRFRPLELYGDNVADYADHLRRLDDALARQPDDPVLLFLYAYQLWFDGRQEEAAPLFERAARLGFDKGPVERFLDARPPEVVPVL
jgi:Tetratricopeptide repeat